MSPKKVFGRINERIQMIKDRKSSSFILLDEDIYDALIVGVSYREDVERTFNGETKVSDIITYFYCIKTEDSIANIRKEYTVSNCI